MEKWNAILKTVSLGCAFFVAAESFAEVVVYSSRKEHLIKPLFDQYTAKTGTKIRYITGKAGPLLERLKAEGAQPQADILLTVDAGNLWKAAQEGVLVPVSSSVLKANIPTHLRDPKGRWFGFSIRARTIVYNTKKVKPSELTTYEALGEAKWKKRLCLRTSKKVYNQSLVAMLIASHGRTQAEEIVRSWVGNLATDVFSNDTKVMNAVAAGQCDVGIVNSYYYGRLMKKKPNTPLALFWPNQKSAGVHVNVSGGGLIKGAKNRKEAIQFLEWLSQPEAQKLFADLNLEYPVHRQVKPHKQVASWGTYRENLINVSKAGELQAESIKLMDRAGYR